MPHPGSQWGKLPIAAGPETISLDTIATAGLKAAITQKNERITSLTKKLKLMYL
jgi:hypothetical protein